MHVTAVVTKPPENKMEDQKKIIVIVRNYELCQDYNLGTYANLSLLFAKDAEKLQPEDVKKIIDFINSLNRKEIE